MRQCAISETFHQLRAVGREVDARWRDQRGDDLLGHLPLHELRQQRIGRGLPDGLVAGQKAEIRKRRVTPVQQAQLHRLERRDVVDELRAGVFPARPRRAEAVLDDPLPERLGRHRRFVVHAGQPLRVRKIG